MKVEKVLFPTDFSRCAGQALPHALFLARSFGAQLHLLHAVVLMDDDPHSASSRFPNPGEIAEELREAAAARMRDDLAAAPETLRVEFAQRRGVSAAAVILDYAAEIGTDVIVVGTHGRRGVERLLLGSVAAEIVREATCPVLTVREQHDEPRVDALDRILVPIDFSAPSAAALLAAKQLAGYYGAGLQLLHVVEEAIVPDFYMDGRVVDPVSPADLRTRARARLARLADEVGGPQVPVEAFAVEGRAWREIVDFVEEHASDLIVISGQGLGGLPGALLGSVADKVARAATCPVLTLKHGG